MPTHTHLFQCLVLLTISTSACGPGNQVSVSTARDLVLPQVAAKSKAGLLVQNVEKHDGQASSIGGIQGYMMTANLTIKAERDFTWCTISYLGEWFELYEGAPGSHTPRCIPLSKGQIVSVASQL